MSNVPGNRDGQGEAVSNSTQVGCLPLDGRKSRITDTRPSIRDGLAHLPNIFAVTKDQLTLSVGKGKRRSGEEEGGISRVVLWVEVEVMEATESGVEGKGEEGADGGSLSRLQVEACPQLNWVTGRGFDKLVKLPSSWRHIQRAASLGSHPAVVLKVDGSVPLQIV